MTGVLFDLDGVIIDSEPIYTDFWNEVDRLYPTGVKDFAIIIKGSNLKQILNTYYPDKNLQKTIIKMIDDFEEKMQYPFFEGVIDFIKDLNENNIPCAVVTSSASSKVNQLFKQHPNFKGLFKGFVLGDMVSKSKPDPECYLLGAKLIGVKPEDCYVFEDSLSGIESGIKAGAKVIGLPTTMPESMIKNKAHKMIKSFVDFKYEDMIKL